jgi:serine/threonine-protein kinase
MTRRAILAAFLLALPAAASAQDDAKKLAAHARQVLETHCYRCHGKDGSAEGGLGYVLDVARLLERKRVIPRHAEKSRLWLRASSSDSDVMPPPDEKPRPSPAELAALKKWIDAGAPEFPAIELAETKRPFLTERDVYKAMHEHLLKADLVGASRYQRFFTLTHLHNNPKVSDANLRLYRAGLAKLLNSLSWRKQAVLPKPVDAHGVVLALDLRDLDWDVMDGWTKLVGFTDAKGAAYPGYPYALKHDRHPEDEALNITAREVYRMTGTSIPAVRVDWFLATASVPPIYHDLLEVTEQAADLEKQLRVDVALNFRRETLARAGFVQSGVSGQNRLVERHPAAFGGYWKSYDFRSNDGPSNLLRMPLGPLNLFAAGKHPYPNQAFEHAGGELLWALPNGLYGFMLTDGDGRRIDEGPVEVVRDKNESAGRGPLILNGLSCMACHKHGVIEFKDEVRAGAAVQGNAKEKVRRLYPDAKTMRRLFEGDEEDYLRALEKVVGPYLRVGADQDRDIRLFPEPVSLLASPYLRAAVSAQDAALELGLSDPKELTAAVKANAKLRDVLGLKAWASGGTLKRQTWESVRDVCSPFQEAAAEMQRGEPVRLRRPRYSLE